MSVADYYEKQIELRVVEVVEELKLVELTMEALTHKKMIKGAWAQGFDIIQGAEQLGGKLVNTRKWIGATEVATLLSSLRFKCQLMDFLRSIKEDSKPPFYLQHEGHSGTVVEIEQLRNGMIFAPVIMLMSLIQVIIVNL
ncbi:hypothetical protein TKK_0006585 [Trichogramma kaykai]